MTNLQSYSIYYSVIVFGTVFAIFSQRKKRSPIVNQTNFNIIPFFIAFLIPAIAMILSKNGSDYISYSNIIIRTNWSNYSSRLDEEPLFNIFIIILKTITRGNVDLTIVMIKLITISNFYYAIFLLRDRINIGYAVFAYLTMVYFHSYYLLAICLSASIVVIAVAMLRLNYNALFPCILILIATQLHNATFLIVPTFLAVYILNNDKTKQLSMQKKVLVIIFYIGITFASGLIFNLSQKYVSSFHYNNYAGNGENGSGLLFFVLYLPLAYIVYRLYKTCSNKNLNNYILVFSLSSAMIRYLAYSYLVIGRVELLLSSLFIILIPEVLYESNILNPDPKKHSVISMLGLEITGYYLFKALITVVGRLNEEMVPYIFNNSFT